MKSLGTIKIDPIVTGAAVSSEQVAVSRPRSPLVTHQSSAPVTPSSLITDHSSLITDRAPRLVVVEAISSATKSFIAKTRSEIAGLDALLSSIAGTALNVK